jgi:hypothetical protein
MLRNTLLTVATYFAFNAWLLECLWAMPGHVT